MAIGLSTYAFQWRSSTRMPRPLTLDDMLDETARLGLSVLQICDYPPIETMDPSQLKAFQGRASDLGITLELGTKGVRPDRLRRYRDIMTDLGATLLRTMFHSPEYRPSLSQAEADLRAVLPEFEGSGMTIAIETYEQVPTAAVLETIERIDRDSLGICLDPGNVVAALELPSVVVDETRDWVVNMHIKDFRFTRAEGSVGFVLSGCPLGEGLLDYERMIEVIRPQERGINQIIEQWLPWQGDPETTWREEERWCTHAAAFLSLRSDLTNRNAFGERRGS